MFLQKKKKKEKWEYGKKREELAKDLKMPQRDAWSEELCSIDSKKSQPNMKQQIRYLEVRALAALSLHIPGTQPWSHCQKEGRADRPWA